MEKAEIIKTVSSLQLNARIPLLIAANVETGTNQTCPEATRIGCPMAIAATGEIKSAEILGIVTGKEAAALGINWAFAPVVDIDKNFRNPITNTRTFGADAYIVAEMSAAYIKAIQEQGVAASAKHFPGDGVDERDQHLLASVNSLSTEEWDDSYGKVYSATIEAGVKTIMAGHIMQPAYSKALDPQLRDEAIMPGLVAEELLHDLLRINLGFNGLIVSDSTIMAGLGTVMPRSEAVPFVIAAGCDMFLFTKNMEEDFSFMRAGIEKGIITGERLNEAVIRILALKASVGLH
jgi:beta-N-acetylhexosaminidase